MAHELAHVKLHGEGKTEKTDEYLTDLCAIFFGFGIFMINSKFNYSQWQGISHQGWQMSASGYLPEQIIAYATSMSLLQNNQEVKEFKNLTSKTAYKMLIKTCRYLDSLNK